MSVTRGLVVVCVLLAVVAAGAVAVENVGGLFAIGTSARGQGLGGAFSALVDDEGATIHNPAALGWYEGLALSSLFAQQFAGVTYASVGLTASYVGINVLLLDSGSIPTGSGVLRYASQGVIASLGVPIDPLGLGVRWRFFRVSSPFAASGWTIDPALLVTTDVIRVGLLYEGALSEPVGYDSGAEEEWEKSVQLGVAVTLAPAADVRWNAEFDVRGLFSSLPRLSGGVEAWIGGVGARVGYDGDGPTFGLSVRFPSLQLDWAYATRSDLGDSHRVGLTLRF
jgi:hypothetical protein